MIYLQKAFLKHLLCGILFLLVGVTKGQNQNPLKDPHFSVTPDFEDTFTNQAFTQSNWNIGHTWGLLNAGQNNVVISLALPQWNNITFSSAGMKITPKEEVVTHNGHTLDYTTGIIHSQNKFHYGILQVEAKLAKGTGFHNAFWTFESSPNPPVCKNEEIDIMEVSGSLSTQCQINQPNLHYGWHDPTDPSDPCKQWHQPESFDTELDLSQAYHTYAVAWLPHEITWFFDGKVIRRLATGGNNAPFTPMHSNSSIPSLLTHIYISLAINNWKHPDASTPFGQLV